MLCFLVTFECVYNGGVYYHELTIYAESIADLAEGILEYVEDWEESSDQIVVGHTITLTGG